MHIAVLAGVVRLVSFLRHEGVCRKMEDGAPSTLKISADGEGAAGPALVGGPQQASLSEALAEGSR